MNGQQIKEAAATIEALASALEQSNAKLVKVANELAVAKKQPKVASEAPEAIKARQGLAKKAAAVMLQTGMLKTAERADKFANEIMDHSTAIKALLAFTEVAGKAQKVATVVEDPKVTCTEESANSVWERSIAPFVRAK